MKSLIGYSFVSLISVVIGVLIILASYDLNTKLLNLDGTHVGFYILFFEVNDYMKISDIPIYTVSYTIIGTSLIVITLMTLIMKILNKRAQGRK